jgi:hypothetical protein
LKNQLVRDHSKEARAAVYDEMFSLADAIQKKIGGTASLSARKNVGIFFD